jgi:NitT/TauT family transport system substrate-binding protein
MRVPITRRQFVLGATGAGLSAAGLALLAGCGPERRPAAAGQADAPLEVTTLKLARSAALCTAAPAYVARALLESEGFQNVEYTAAANTTGSRAATAADAAISLGYAPYLLTRIDAGDPIVIIGGLHGGCLELLGSERVRRITDLKGKTIAVAILGNPSHIFLATMLTYVGIDPHRDVTWVAQSRQESIELLLTGQLDAYIDAPPAAQELRARQIGPVIVNTTTDRPWSQYYCCMVAGNREFVQRYPVATKRALRAILKATELCAGEPERAVQAVVENAGLEPSDYALDGIRDIPYAQWREYDAADTLRFFALRLHEARWIQTSPEKLLAQGTDWRFFDELKRELKS